MMNRIILIGNGFDLAHGLATSYMDFINHYWEQWGERLQGTYLGNKLTDNLCSISQKGEQRPWYWIFPAMNIRTGTKITPKEVIDTVKMCPDGFLIEKKPFFQYIDKAIETKNWVDIENEFYLWLKKIHEHDCSEYNCPTPLNEELESIKECLVEYLKSIQKELISPELVKDCIWKTIYEPFNARDISVGAQGLFEEFLVARLKYLFTEDDREISSFLYRFGQSFCETHSDIESYKELVQNPSAPDSPDIAKHLKKVNDNKGEVPSCFLLPEQILLLNFNYTKTADLYIPAKSDFEVNHIHGELGNDENPVIFGYGDELDEDYKRISDLNDNSYLTNIKSIRYLETDNYRRLLRFIASAPYQIYIMGHSCGNSDRTLLNTLFEHRNCVSIKPYYHLREDGSDNYIEIIQNISRNFNDMQTMRDRVVNKSYCRPLVPREN